MSTMRVCMALEFRGDGDPGRENGTATLSDARSKLVILGIGDDGLAGLTERGAGW